MFAWLKNWRLRKRRLFRYFDGRRWVYGDPLSILRRLWGDKQVDLRALLPFVDTLQEPETGQALDFIAKVFSVPRWDGNTGLTDGELLDLVEDLAQYIDRVKKNSNSGPTSPEPTASVSSISLVEPTMSACSDCGSTPSESS